MTQVESVQDQYITRHLPDGRIIYADHRIATIAGYLPGEVVMITTIRCLHQNVKIDLFFFRWKENPLSTSSTRRTSLGPQWQWDIVSSPTCKVVLGLVHIYNWHRSGLICYFYQQCKISVFASSSGEGSTVYRLLTQTGQYICLQVQLGKTVILQISLGLSFFSCFFSFL